MRIVAIGGDGFIGRYVEEEIQYLKCDFFEEVALRKLPHSKKPDIAILFVGFADAAVCQYNLNLGFELNVPSGE